MELERDHIMWGLTSLDTELYSEDSRKTSVALNINVTTWFMLFCGGRVLPCFLFLPFLSLLLYTY